MPLRSTARTGDRAADGPGPERDDLRAPVNCDRLGVVQVITGSTGAFTVDDQRLVQALADHAAIAITHAELYRDVEQASLTDDLTGLGNTWHFHRLFPPLLHRAQPLSLVVLDLDQLKAVVDGYGHLVGSRTIATVGRLIGSSCAGRSSARFGGDENVVILPSTDTAAGARRRRAHPRRRGGLRRAGRPGGRHPRRHREHRRRDGAAARHRSRRALPRRSTRRRTPSSESPRTASPPPRADRAVVRLF